MWQAQKGEDERKKNANLLPLSTSATQAKTNHKGKWYLHVIYFARVLYKATPYFILIYRL